MDNSNKQAIVNAIWENPANVFNCQFKQSGKYLENLRGGDYDERGKIRLAQTATGSNIMVFYNGGSRQEKTDVFTYIQDYVLHTAGFKETLIEVAKLYNITLEFSQEEREALNRAALSREVGASLIEALRMNPQGETARYITEVRGLTVDGVHFGELTPDSLNRAKQALKLRNLSYTEDDLKALGLTEYNANNGYTCVIPYYRNGIIQGFVLRNTRPNLPKETPRYLYSSGLGRGGYCDTLKQGEPAVIVEGQMDAIRLIQAGIINVIAMGGAKISNDIGNLLKSRNIDDVTYIPDLEYNEQGEKKTDIIKEAIKGFQSVQADGEQVIRTLYVTEIPTPEGVNLNGLKIDADTYGKEHGAAALEELLLLEGLPWYQWEFNALLQWGYKEDNVKFSVMEGKIREIYTRCNNPFERERIRQYVTRKEVKHIFEAFGITPRSLDDVDEWNRNRAYNNAIKENAAALSKAVEEQATPETIRGIVSRLNDAQANNTREEWEKQLNQSFEDELDAIRQQPDTLKTKWDIGNISKTGDYIPYGKIEFFPADIAVFCAPTSHGKTMILFNAALDAVRTTDKTYLYVSCEENNRQLLERALNVYLDIPTTKDGKDAGQYCFKEQTRRKSIKAVIRGTVPPEYAEFMGGSEHWNALNRSIKQGLNRYAEQVRPRLKLIHTDATTESICNNVLRVVREYQEQGVQVGGVFVDYMQLLTTEGKQFSRHDELKDICKALHDCAAELELPVIIAAQFNREALKSPIDEITVANIGEGADIERIAHDIFLLWQIDKTPLYPYYPTKTGKEAKEGGLTPAREKMGERARRIFENTAPMGQTALYEPKRGYMYIEHIKARDNKTGGWALLPFDGERNYIGETDKAKMR